MRLFMLGFRGAMLLGDINLHKKQMFVGLYLFFI